MTHFNLVLETIVSTDTVEDSDDDDEGGDYLHPSLFASKRCSRLEELTKVPMKSNLFCF